MFRKLSKSNDSTGRATPVVSEVSSSSPVESRPKTPVVIVPTTTPSASSPPPSPSTWTRASRKVKKKSSQTVLTSQTTKFSYQLGEKIGKGGDGLVHTALNLDTGEVVAVKTLKFAASVQMELSLLKKLVHPNIVNYVDSIRDGDHLHIVLEYMENGSLRSLCDKFDGFSESLVAIYVTQTLHGLRYLHEQGVLHRDIKGANILTTKDGSVKLADFGVAMSMSDASVTGTSDQSADVVGSPYWMAPEIIEMQTPTTGCDIWSLGCTIIELLTGKPPYMELEPMSALFRIVQDNHPPLPRGISESLKSFLLLCFNKDPTKRDSAENLLSHQWLQNPQSHVKNTQYLLRESDLTSGPGWDSVVETLRLYARGSMEKMPDDDSLSLSADDSSNLRHSMDGAMFASASASVSASVSASFPASTNDHSDIPSSTPDAPSSLDNESRSLGGGAFQVLRSISRGMLGMSSSSPSPEKPQPSSSPPRAITATPPLSHFSSSPIPVNVTKPDLIEASQFLPPPHPDSILSTTLQRSISEPNTATTFLSAPRRSPPTSDTRSRAGTLSIDESLDTTFSSSPSISAPSPIAKDTHHPDVPLPPSPSFSVPPNTPSAIDKENHIVRSKLSDEVLALVSSLQPGCDESTIVKNCRQMLKIFNEHPELPQHFVMQHGVIPIMELLEVSKLRSESIMDGVRSVRALPAVLQVVNKIIEDNLIVQEHLSLVGMIPCDGENCRWDIQLNFHLDDRFLPLRHFAPGSRKVRQPGLQDFPTDAAKFIAGGGLPLLVKHLTLASDLRRSSDIEKIVGIGIDGILNVFSLQTIRRDDFCHLFVKLGLLPHIVVGFRNFLGNLLEEVGGHSKNPKPSPENQERTSPWVWLEKLGKILTFFAQSDPLVKERMAIENVCLGILNPFISLSLTNELTTNKASFKSFSNLIVVLLQCVRALSVEPKTLKKLDREQAIVTLMPLLEQKQPSFDNKIFDETIQCMYYLCRIDKNRQELAARCGLIQHLKGCILQKKLHLNQFSFPLICDMAYTSAQTREELWRCDGVVFYLSILQHEKWRISALNALTVWLATDMDRVEPVLTLPVNSEILIKCFVECLTSNAGAGEGTFDQICEALLRLSIKSTKLSRILGRNKIFVNHLVNRLQSDSTMSALARMCLLKMLGQIVNKNTYTEHGIFPMLAKFANDETQILISTISKNLMKRVT
eukprot:CAMPEP_0118635422 /NCGR_PEP_ID=MMETSP0785-20121206/2070_1 /TAXON_ID=91992 /ORGANISM="Bolidomonas pacifica, Strain CCMP 1866" /LENGTH=1196 /DNA_ID=CAMNT_0006526459 /DNA_START=294 /DNA_END=3882 /DNA_ORIENTATION=+